MTHRSGWAHPAHRERASGADLVFDWEALRAFARSLAVNPCYLYHTSALQVVHSTVVPSH